MHLGFEHIFLRLFKQNVWNTREDLLQDILPGDYQLYLNLTNVYRVKLAKNKELFKKLI